MALTLEEVEHIAALARLHLSDEEKNRFREQLSAILEYVSHLQALTRRAPDDFPDHFIMKSIVRPDTIVSYLHPHQSLVLGCYVQEDGTPVFPIDGRCTVPKWNKLAINHYFTKSRQQLLKKRERGRPLGDGDPEKIRAMEFFTLRDRNDVEDATIQRFLPELKKLVQS